MEENSIDVWQTDPVGFLLYATKAFELALQPGTYNVPYGALIKEPPQAPAGYVARAENGTDWVLVEDHRFDTLYYVKVAATESEPAVIEQYQMRAEVRADGELVSYDGGGPIPGWLTATAPEPTQPQITP